ncbi:MAG: YedE family putative selenium transporter [Chloroflexota bacterium]
MTGLVGMVAGVLVGVFFLKRGFNLGRAVRMSTIAGLVMPVMMTGLLLLAIFRPAVILISEKGPGAMFAPLGLSLAAGLVIGMIAQKTRLCSVGAWRDIFLARDFYLFSGIAAFFVAALVTNYALGNFAAGGIYHWGFAGEPIAHTDHLWNFLSMSLVGLAATLVGGCPLRNLILSGEGDTDASMMVLGLFAGAAFSHNFLLAASPSGIGAFSAIAVIIGLIFCVAIGFLMRQET